MIYTILISVYFVIILTHTVYNIVITYKNHKRETYALILRRDLDDSKVKINPNKDSFEHDKNIYNISKEGRCYLAFNRKLICAYLEGSPDAINFYNEKDTIMNSDMLHSFIKSEALKLLNRPSLMGGIDLKKILIGGAFIVFIIVMFM